MNILVGKSKISIDAEGCYKCGTTFSSGWRVFKEITIKIEKREFIIPIHICVECDKKEIQPNLL